MVYLAEYNLRDSGKIRIEVEDIEQGFVDSFLGYKILETGKEFEEVLSEVEPAINALYDRINGLKSKPKSVSVEFGLKFVGKGGAFIASAGMEAQFKITVTWEENRQ